MFYIAIEPENLYLINLSMDIGLLIENVACFPVTHEISHNRKDVGFVSVFICQTLSALQHRLEGLT